MLIKRDQDGISFTFWWVRPIRTSCHFHYFIQWCNNVPQNAKLEPLLFDKNYKHCYRKHDSKTSKSFISQPATFFGMLMYNQYLKSTVSVGDIYSNSIYWYNTNKNLGNLEITQPWFFTK